jgi:hypothetical protein
MEGTMTITLPSDVASILDEIGVQWPDVDEDALHQMANDLDDFGKAAQQACQQGNTAARQLTSSNSGKDIDAFEKLWQSISNGPLHELGSDYQSCSQALRGLASGVTDAKNSILAEVKPLTSALGQLAAGALKAIEDALPQVKKILGEILDALGEVGWAIFAVVADLFGADFPASWSKYQQQQKDGKKDYSGDQEKNKEINEGLENGTEDDGDE